MTQTPTYFAEFAAAITDSQTVGLASSFWLFAFPNGHTAHVSPSRVPLHFDLETGDEMWSALSTGQAIHRLREVSERPDIPADERDQSSTVVVVAAPADAQATPTAPEVDDDQTVTHLVVLQMGPAAKTPTGYTCTTHLVRGTRRGTPGPTLCGIDRFAKDAPGWGFGGIDGPRYTQEPCAGCVDVAATQFGGLPVEGSIGAKEFRAALMTATHVPS